MSSTKSLNSEVEGREGQSGERHITVSPEQDGLRLDQVLVGHPDITSREMARRLILQDAAQRNGEKATPATRVKAGDTVSFHVPPAEPLALAAEPYPLKVLYEDSSLIVIDKPVGMPMHPSPGHFSGTLVNHLLAHCNDLSGIGGTQRPGIVHRLDKDTSGVVVVAKTDRAHLHLAEQFKARSIERTYLALAVGHPREDKGVIDLPLSRQKVNRLRRGVDSAGKRAVTHWWVRRRLGPFVLFKVKLETGRTHQIRVHLAHKGWPVLGDPLYGAKRHRGLNLPPELARALETLPGQALHAAVLGFVHPVTGEAMHFTSPLPEPFAGVLALLESAYGTPDA